MYELNYPALPFWPELPVIDVRIAWFRIDIIPTDNCLFPEVHIETKMDVQIKP